MRRRLRSFYASWLLYALLRIFAMSIIILFLMILRPPISTLFPYTTLFRSGCALGYARGGAGAADQRAGAAARQVCRPGALPRSEEHTSELQSRFDLVCRLLLEKKN